MNWYKKTILSSFDDSKIYFLSKKHKLDKNTILNLSSIDPTKNKIFLDWLCFQFKNNKINLVENNKNIFNVLKLFEKNKNILRSNDVSVDILKYNSIEEIQEILKNITFKTETKEERPPHHSMDIHDSGDDGW